MTMRKSLIALAMTAAPALASPYCVEVTGIPPQCLYVDPAQCQGEADRLGGRCTANADELKLPVNQSPFCIAESGSVVTCGYPDLATCRSEAVRHRGACIAAPPPPALHAAPDPFAVKRPY